MDLSSWRIPSRRRLSARPSVRARAPGPGPVATVVVVAVGIVIAGAATAVPPASRIVADVRSAVGAAARSTAPAARASLPDVPWLAQRGDGIWIYGRGERGPVRRLPAGETGLAIGEARVASVVADAHRRSIVRFRDRATGRLVRDVAAPIWASAGAWTSAGLVVTGYEDASMAGDGGLVLIEPDSGALTTLVEAGPFSRRLGTPVARGDVAVSPSGATVASNACGIERCDLQVVDLATGRVSRPVDGALGFLRVVTDDAVITTDDSYAWISSRAIADGSERWRIRNSALIDPIALEGGAIVGLVGSDRAGWAVATIDASGRSRDLTSRSRGDQPLPRIWRPLSIGTAIVVGRAPFEEALAGGTAMPVVILGPRGGGPVKATVQLPATSEAVP